MGSLCTYVFHICIPYLSHTEASFMNGISYQKNSVQNVVAKVHEETLKKGLHMWYNLGELKKISGFIWEETTCIIPEKNGMVWYGMVWYGSSLISDI